MILSCGDALIDFVPVAAADGGEAVRPVVGGSCLNVAVGLARLGTPTGFVGGLSNDLFGSMIAQAAQASDVDLRFAARSDRKTTLAFVRHVEGESQYAFYDEGTASREWTYRRGSIPFATVEAVHVGSTTLVSACGAAETAALVADARPTSTISFDPNCRPNLVTDKDAYLARMEAFAATADIIKMSEVDFVYLHGSKAHAHEAEALFAQGATLFVITCGADGAQAWHSNLGFIKEEAPQVDVVDTIGAGDSFQSALLTALHRLDRLARSRLDLMTADELRRALSFACRCAALTCTRVGADPPGSGDVPW